MQGWICLFRLRVTGQNVGAGSVSDGVGKPSLTLPAPSFAYFNLTVTVFDSV